MVREDSIQHRSRSEEGSEAAESHIYSYAHGGGGTLASVNNFTLSGSNSPDMLMVMGSRVDHLYRGAN